MITTAGSRNLDFVVKVSIVGVLLSLPVTAMEVAVESVRVLPRKELGADEAIDYTQRTFDSVLETKPVDVVIDTLGGGLLSALAVTRLQRGTRMTLPATCRAC